MAGAGVGKLPLAGEEPTKPQEAARQLIRLGDVHEHAAEDTCAGRARQRAALPLPVRLGAQAFMLSGSSSSITS